MGTGLEGRVPSRLRPSLAWLAAATSRWRHSPTLQLVVFALALRVMTALLAFLANAVFPTAQPLQFTVFGQPNEFWDAFARHDSGWYRSIARHGYQYIEGQPNNLAFFPLYPMLVRVAGLALGGWQGAFYIGGVVVSWAAFLGAVPLFYHLARLDLDPPAARRATIYLSVFPFAFFYGVVYSESLFLLLTVAAFLGFRLGAWKLGGPAGALAACTRVNGVLMLPSLAWAGWRAAGSDPARRRGLVIALALVPLGVGLYSLYVYSMSGSPLEWYHSIERWDYHPGGAPWAPLVALTRQLVRRPYGFLTVDPNGPFDALNGLTAIAVILSIPFVWRRLGAAYGLFMLVNLWLPLSSGEFEGLGRYCAVLFPLFIWLGRFRSDVLQASILVAFSCLYMLCLALFANVYPIF